MADKQLNDILTKSVELTEQVVEYGQDNYKDWYNNIAGDLKGSNANLTIVIFVIFMFVLALKMFKTFIKIVFIGVVFVIGWSIINHEPATFEEKVENDVKVIKEKIILNKQNIKDKLSK